MIQTTNFFDSLNDRYLTLNSLYLLFYWYICPATTV